MRIKLVTVVLSLFCSISSHALSQNQIASCRQGSRTYDTYASYLDNYLSKLIQRYRSGTTEYKDQMKVFIRAHEDFKDKEYVKLLEVQDALISEKKESRASTEAWRIFMEATIDIAYVAVGENMVNEQLGRTSEHYRRKIYEICTSSK
jgi:hypothetical protein